MTGRGWNAQRRRANGNGGGGGGDGDSGMGRGIGRGQGQKRQQPQIGLSSSSSSSSSLASASLSAGGRQDQNGGGGQGQAVVDDFSSFFNFGSRPLPAVVQPASLAKPTPSLNGVVVKQKDETEEQDWMSAPLPGAKFRKDENRSYVEHHRKKTEEMIERLRLEVALEEEKSDGMSSIFGAVPDKTDKSDLTDPNVFWKFDMKKRMVDTTHLVINSYEKQICDLLSQKQVLVVQGFTGCGKTTQVPQFILNHAAERAERVRVVVTQPRRLAAISVANRVCEERGWKLGTIVGYQVGMDRMTTDDTRVVYMTTGVLLQILIGKKSLEDFTHIIIDEVHERDLDTDLLLLIIKKIMIDRRDTGTKVILMSATLDSSKFINYFPVLSSYEDRDRSHAVVAVTQPSLFKVDEFYLDDITGQFGLDGFDINGSEEPKIYQECYELACKIIDGLDFMEFMEQETSSGKSERKTGDESIPIALRLRHRGAVLVFLPGYAEIDQLYKQLMEISILKAGGSDKPDVVKWNLHFLHSSVTADEQQKVFRPAPQGHRKVILATNIAESSITVPDIKYVIDFCLTKSLSCDPSTNYTCLRLDWASKNQCIQRRGRCGRVAPGILYRLISRSFYENIIPQEALPEMERASLESVILNVKLLQMGSPLEVLANAIDPPKQSGIARAICNLKEVGALTLAVRGQYDDYDGDMTYMGHVMAKLPIDFRLGRLIVLGHCFGVVDDAIVIAAALSTKTPFSHPYGVRLDAWLSKFGWGQKSSSDCIALLNVFQSWTQHHRDGYFRTLQEERSWARNFYVQLPVLREISSVVQELEKRLKMVNIFADTHFLKALERGMIIKLVIAGAFYPNYFYRCRPSSSKEHQRDLAREAGGFDPLRTVFLTGFPLDQPGKLYAKFIADRLTYNDCVPQVHFRSAKVYVNYDPRSEKVGSVNMGVYRAVKMRQLRERVTFTTLERDFANKAVEEAEEFFTRHTGNIAPKCNGFPSVEEPTFECFVCWLDNPCEFYVIRHSDTAVNKSMEEALHKLASGQKGQLPILSRPSPGQLCIVSKKGRFMRGRIEFISNIRALVYCIDVGCTLWKQKDQLYDLTPDLLRQDFHKIAALALPSRLSELKLTSKHNEAIEVEAIKEFEAFIKLSDNHLIFETYSVVEGVVAGDLFSPKTKTRISSVLLEEGYLEKSFESHESMNNNTVRRCCKITNYGEDAIKSIDEKQATCWQPTRYIIAPKPVVGVGTKVELRGPNSPLEMSFTSICRSAHMKQVQIEGNSVNCVSLDTDPFTPCSRLLIAGSVGIAHKSGNIMARDTTLMPAIPGLVSLLAMTFAPRLEFRTDQFMTKYTGCITGLGTDVMGKEVYADHDMEIIFDVEIDNEDVDLVNSIRVAFNMLLRQDTAGPEAFENLRRRLRADFLKLLQREREPVDECWPVTTHVWNALPRDARLLNSDASRYVEDTDVFSLHVGLELHPPSLDAENAVPHNVFVAPGTGWN